MTDIELQKMVVKIVSDNAQFIKGMTETVSKVVDVASNIQHATDKIEGLTNRLSGFASAAVGTLASFGLATSLQGAFQAFSDFEEKAVKFDAVLEFNQRNVKETISEYKRFATEMMNTTTISKGQVFGLLKTAETMGFTGEKAEQLAKASIGLGSATDMDAASTMRMVIALERGDTHMLRRIPALRGIHDQTQLVAKAQELMAMGMKQEHALTETSGFKMEKLGRTFKGLSMEVGGMVAEAITPLLNMMQRLAEMFTKMEPETKKIVSIVLLSVLGFLALKPALSAVNFLLAPLVSLVKFLVIDLVVLGSLKVISFAFWILWSVAILTTKVALWLFNAALLTTNALFAAGYLLAAVGVFIALGAALVIIGAAGYAAWKAAEGLFDIFKNTPELLGPFKALGNELKEWPGIFKAIFEAAQVDMKLAGKITKAAWELAVQQVQDLWPPLWTFIKIGFETAATYASARFVSEMNVMAEKAKVPFLEMAREAAKALAFGNDTKFVRDAREAVNKQKEEVAKAEIEAAENAGRLAEAAKKRLEAAAAGVAFIESPEAKRLKEALDKIIKEELPLAKKKADQGADSFKGFGEQVKHAKEETQKLQGVLRFSADAFQHILDFQEKLRAINAPVVGAAGAGAGAGGVGGAAGGQVAPAPAGAPAPPAPANNPMLAEQVKTNRLIAQTNVILTAMANKQGVNPPALNLNAP